MPIMDTFKQFANSTIKASPILTEAEIELLLLASNHDALYRYAYRIAGFVTVYARQNAPAGIDDTDWQDAVQECMVRFPGILATYRRTDAPFLRYMSRTFQNVIKRYLWDVIKGGTGSSNTIADPTTYLDHLTGEWGSFSPLPGAGTQEGQSEDSDMPFSLNVPESTGFGTRDPLVELMADEAMERAMRYAKRHPKTGPKEL
jgi:hypothetical protein